MVRLLDDQALERSSVVANCAMNRERGLTGSNGYGRELGIDVVGLITERLARGAEVFRWLDLCCGTGTALLECARLVDDPRLHVTGVDLVDFFAGPPHPRVEFVTTSVGSFTPERCFDLVTCVHGLHYVGDKLDVLARAASWLAADGLLVANLDLAAVVSEQGRPWRRRLAGVLRSAGFDYDARRRRITCTGRRQVRLPFEYLGADDQAGPNYTGQPAVNSYYADTRAGLG
ncbi:class I SAM-dependent methyltransferase [Saccharothrix variisporea]|uniref:Methyltransferase family protein n=1 Tax=Saccharothrix variisporea TaxID=543527 RepID=A0A495X626_9PSEU|nr:class I SAM-dependent methyltransferase [Saccharothrix variisporea]RKT68514.1 methyltransferase family protein [Saccharothrix variisporea]